MLSFILSSYNTLINKIYYATVGTHSSIYLLLLARSNLDHYAKECEIGILKKITKQNKNRTKQEELSSVFLTKWGVP